MCETRRDISSDLLKLFGRIERRLPTMYHNLLATLNAEVSGIAAKNLVARISQWHRIQASPMYREAAEWVHATLRSWGLDARIDRYSAQEGVMAWGEPLFQEWWCDAATLHLI